VEFDAVILAGGAARRMGGIDKAEVVLGETRLLDRALEAVAGASRVVVVGPPRPAPDRVLWTREEPPGGGPVPALAAGLAETSADVVVVLAVDMPFVDGAVVDRLFGVMETADGAILTDTGGRDQPLAGVYRADALRERLDALPRHPGASVGDVVGGLRLTRVPATIATLDCDTWDDVRAARAHLSG
jgi:molybdopterin-guanine dinucleotide biosynthesis protein A